MINFKQKELIDKLFNKVKKEFPEIELINVVESPEDPNDLWVRITEPNDEDREIELSEFAAEIEIDILMDYGYHIMIIPTRDYKFTKTHPNKSPSLHQSNVPVVSDEKAPYHIVSRPRMNFKQEELIEKLFKQVKEKFPEIELIKVTESAEDPNDLWVMVTVPENEDREIALSEYAAEIETDILMDYGYHIAIMPTRNHQQAKA